ncbi:phosphoadenosine phosphosulfate reductase family protein [Erythrobacter gaetbuli]|uniref:Phosphoadenosine phosphosulfate reductase family protein n=1 Tax=Qipengyuania gaetbuli TaxID=266952 RepID=A0A844XXL2_9SPHN|nr:phosphoadenosine phosphosulfate reductase family protein [Qipengyuania gaetbuli]MXO50700.1 phosphoadenosine phosphosulfate reductase family protein [Qipengyuania gaetbuli]
MNDPVLSAIEHSAEALEVRHDSRWIVGYSGGKDSTATLKILLSAWKLATKKPPFFDLIYCDTGVENQILDKYIKNQIQDINREAELDGLPIRTTILKAPVQESFFVKIIGRGYPPPTNSFRWCTKALRINPVASFLKAATAEQSVVALGLRRDESQQRTRSLEKNGSSHWQRQRESTFSYDVYLPILELDVPAVWDAIFGLTKPRSISASDLEDLYRGASGECPIIKSPQSPPCGSGRFGCWTCTVVRKDKSAEKLIRSGYTQLSPFLEFRNWLAEFRNDPNARWKKRRNGSEGLGPFTMDARYEILRRVDALEDATGTEIITSEERGMIAALWKFDDVPRLSFKL